MVTGFKLVHSNITYTLYVDESTRTCQVKADRKNVSIPVGETFMYNDFAIPEKYRPLANSTKPIYRAYPEILSFILRQGQCGVYNNGTARTGWDMYFIHEWQY